MIKLMMGLAVMMSASIKAQSISNANYGSSNKLGSCKEVKQKIWSSEYKVINAQGEGDYIVWEEEMFLFASVMKMAYIGADKVWQTADDEVVLLGIGGLGSGPYKQPLSPKYNPITQSVGFVRKTSHGYGWGNLIYNCDLSSCLQNGLQSCYQVCDTPDADPNTPLSVMASHLSLSAVLDWQWGFNTSTGNLAVAYSYSDKVNGNHGINYVEMINSFTATALSTTSVESVQNPTPGFRSPEFKLSDFNYNGVLSYSYKSIDGNGDTNIDYKFLIGGPSAQNTPGTYYSEQAVNNYPVSASEKMNLYTALFLTSGNNVAIIGKVERSFLGNDIKMLDPTAQTPSIESINYTDGRSHSKPLIGSFQNLQGVTSTHLVFQTDRTVTNYGKVLPSMIEVYAFNPQHSKFKKERVISSKSYDIELLGVSQKYILANKSSKLPKKKLAIFECQ